MRVVTRRALPALAGAGALLALSAAASAASWSPAQRVPNDSGSATSALGSSQVVANMASSGRASIVFRARGNRLWVSRRASATGRFAKATRAFPNARAVTNRFDVAMDGKGRLAVALGHAQGVHRPLTKEFGAIQGPKGFGATKRLNPNVTLTYAAPTVVSTATGAVYAGFSGEGLAKGGVWVMRGATGTATYTSRKLLARLDQTSTPAPPHVELGVASNDTVYAAYRLPDGTIATSRRSAAGTWTRLPNVGQAVNGQEVDAFRMSVPSSGPVVMALAQDGDITVRRLTSVASGWSAPETVAADAYTPVSKLPTTFPGPSGVPALPVLAGLGVATNSRQDVVVAWGTNGADSNFPGAGVLFGGIGAKIEYSRAMRTAGDTAWPAATTSAEPAYDPETSFFSLSNVSVAMDNARRAVVAYTSSGATNSVDNPLAVTTWNGTAASTWSGTQDLSRFCDTSGNVVGPSLAAAGRRGVVIAWGCGSSTGQGFRSGLVWTRSFR
jgi:hypothetical protein